MWVCFLGGETYLRGWMRGGGEWTGASGRLRLPPAGRLGSDVAALLGPSVPAAGGAGVSARLRSPSPSSSRGGRAGVCGNSTHDQACHGWPSAHVIPGYVAGPFVPTRVHVCATACSRARVPGRAG